MVSEEVTTYARQLNELFFRLLYRQDACYEALGDGVPLPQLMLDLTKLAESYGGSELVRSDILLALCRPNHQGKDWCLQ